MMTIFSFGHFTELLDLSSSSYAMHILNSVRCINCSVKDGKWRDAINVLYYVMTTLVHSCIVNVHATRCIDEWKSEGNLVNK